VICTLNAVKFDIKKMLVTRSYDALVLMQVISTVPNGASLVVHSVQMGKPE